MHTWRCFNGAATLSLRKSCLCSIISLNICFASMGPQLYRCGNLRKPYRKKGGAMASMGPQLYRCGNWRPRAPRGGASRCFNGAATLSLRKYLTSTAGSLLVQWLQWGRNFIVAEMRLDPLEIVDIPHASMGPQLYRCGNGDDGDDVSSLGAASMGPQLYRCGNKRVSAKNDNHGCASMGPQLYRCGN